MTPPAYLENPPSWCRIGIPWDAGDDAENERESKDLGPEPGGRDVAFIAGAQGAPFPQNDEPGQTHRQLGEQVVIGDGEAELDSVPEHWIADGAAHVSPLRERGLGGGHRCPDLDSSRFWNRGFRGRGLFRLVRNHDEPRPSLAVM
jgi:hypothetical protein